MKKLSIKMPIWLLVRRVNNIYKKSKTNIGSYIKQKISHEKP